MISSSGCLKDWNELGNQYEFESLVVGNGASINIWDGFAYPNLFHQAQSKLSKPCRDLFERLRTKNFETVLSYLHFSKIVLETYDKKIEWLEEVNQEIKQEFFDAVSENHIKPGDLSEEVKSRVSECLASFRKVFILNYDLISYWSLMGSSDRGKFVDFMFDFCKFDKSNVGVSDPNRTKIFYPHGALQFWYDPKNGRVGKYKSGDASILDQVGQDMKSQSDKRPLLVSGADEVEKMATIGKYDYLLFAYNSLANDRKCTVVFGTELAECDTHIVRAIRSNSTNSHVAISIYTKGKEESVIRSEVAHLTERLSSGEDPKLDPAKIHFFDSETFPLGGADMCCR